MKTPEEYLPRSEPSLRKFKDGTEDIIYVPRYVAINSLKSMQSEHEKELSKIKEGVEQIMRSVVAADPTLMDICLKIIREDIDKVLTQFRNKQQDR